MDRDNKNKLKLLRLLELLRRETDEHHPMTTEKICQEQRDKSLHDLTEKMGCGETNPK